MKGYCHLLTKIKRDPFRLFFPVGWVLSLYGASLWIMFQQNLLSTYPGQHHAQLMFNGFLLCFVLGFLMTAVPRFTETSFATTFEVACSVGLILSLTWNGLTANQFNLDITMLIGVLFAMLYSIKRFVGRQSNPPDTFIFVGLSLGLGVVGLCLILTSNAYQFGKALVYQAMMLGLILGIGGRLIPGIFGWTEIVKSQRDRYERSESFLRTVSLANYIGAAIFTVSFIIEFFWAPTLGRILRAIVVSYIAVTHWKLIYLPKKRTIHTLSIWVSCWIILVSAWLYCGYPSINTLHLQYIGGFGLLAVLIGSRVILAHGNDGHSIEAKKFPLGWVGFLLIVAAATRSSIYLVPDSYVTHLAYAAGIWIIGLILWGIVFIPRIFK